jgi:riboflavin kinase / FMN adenylyltransferase
VQVIADVHSRPWPGRRSVVTIGAYDGVHLGHRSVIGHVCDRAREFDAVSVVVTFDRHPAEIVRPESAPLLLTDVEQKLGLLSGTGIDATVVVHFDDEQRDEAPEAFVRRVLVEALGARVVVVGEDFHFGRARAGNVELLRRLGAEHDFVVEPMRLVARTDAATVTGSDTASPVSSTAVRRALDEGDVEAAASMLGRLHEVRGTVAAGDQRGRTIGFPTANVEVPGRICLPADGVYAGWYERPDGSIHQCAVNIGRRPTFYEDADRSLVEAHLLDFDGDLYGEGAQVRFVARLRGERRFDGIESLATQLQADVERARAVLRLASGVSQA